MELRSAVLPHAVNEEHAATGCWRTTGVVNLGDVGANLAAETRCFATPAALLNFKASAAAPTHNEEAAVDGEREIT